MDKNNDLPEAKIYVFDGIVKGFEEKEDLYDIHKNSTLIKFLQEENEYNWLFPKSFSLPEQDAIINKKVRFYLHVQNTT